MPSFLPVLLILATTGCDQVAQRLNDKLAVNRPVASEGLQEEGTSSADAGDNRGDVRQINNESSTATKRLEQTRSLAPDPTQSNQRDAQENIDKTRPTLRADQREEGDSSHVKDHELKSSSPTKVETNEIYIGNISREY